MITYLIRRSMQGVFVVWLASFLAYTILVLAPGGPLHAINFGLGPSGVKLSSAQVCQLKRAYKLDKPWPLNYVAWLFDPRDITRLNDRDEVVPKGLDITIPAITIGQFRIGPSLNPAPPQQDHCEALLGIDPPPADTDGNWHIRGSGALTGDLGNSLVVQRGTPVLNMLGARLGNTLILMLSVLLLSLLIAFPIGIASAIKQYSRLDYTVTTFSFVGISMPSFWLGLMLIIFFAVIPRQLHDISGWSWMPYLPPGNISDLDREGDIFNRVWHLILPVSVLAFTQVANWSRFVRSSMLEVLRQDYVRTAWAKGLAMRVVVMKHALRNALIPLITILTLALPGLVQGAIITEAVFAYGGMGRLYFDAVTKLDYTLVMGFLMIITALFVLSNILADALYAVVDPRIRLG